MVQKKTTEQFIEEARKVHGDKYDYSKAQYVNAKTKIAIICPSHGVFEQIPDKHLRGAVCPMCKADKRRLTQEEFIKRASFTHNNFYDYSMVCYKDNESKTTIICPIHGSI